LKHPDWHRRLINFLVSQQNAHFIWGQNDCCLFACACVLAITGTDPMAQWRGKYTTELGAKRYLKKYGGGTILNAFNAVFGPIKPRLNANNGDLILIDTDQGDAVGIMQGCQVWAVGPAGLITLPISKAIGCWPIEGLK
jgi:hypothetical protein